MRNEHLLDPFMPKNPVMLMSWLGGLGFALRDDKTIAQFRSETGNNWKPAKSGIEQMIDDATEAEADFFVQFAKWYNANVWGENEDGSVYDVGDESPEDTTNE